MIYVDILNIEDMQYRKLINHIISSCDEISFQLPGVYDNGKVIPEKTWQEYHEKNKTLLQKCFYHGAKQLCSKHYQGMKLGQYGKIVYVKPFQELEQLILNNHLYDWLMINNLPEDLCFHSKKQLRFFTCSHEEEFIIFKESQKDIDFLNENSFEFLMRKETR